MKLTVKILFILVFNMLLLSCESKSRQDIINNELAYPMSIQTVLSKIGQPDSITTENHDTGVFGVRVNKIYHYGSNQLVFSPHNIYMGKK
ncbi:hypothetical protein [Maribacter sp. MAR_2009_72]|uniref:hypothetical protein n=1 Tax=Maribacter sp. MAR_2009_72 TaxID=1250050 RepID=UPI0011995123|nr:hypothetical protein [Maribacter sp. MAR_2009_72]TVZ14016.1 hypothetical protein JM81_0213 [Maribacter sp. MAR_2009_72]